MKRVTLIIAGLVGLVILGSLSVETIYGQSSVTTSQRLTPTNFSRPDPPPVDPDPKTPYIP